MAASRREFLGATAAGAAGMVVTRSALAGGPEAESASEEIAATEDLMREHGVLDRVLLIYEEGLRRLTSNDEIAPVVFQRAGELARRFIEDYHERLEENYVFPAFNQAGRLADLVAMLKEQHKAGRAVTDDILRLSAGNAFRDKLNQQRLAAMCRAYIRMYRPHAAREDTVLFPALRSVLSADRVRELGEQFEEQEHKLFGEEGFQKTVEQVAAIEKDLGVFDLKQFTPTLNGR